MKLISTNPAKNYEEIGSVEISTREEIEEKVMLAQKAKKAWKELGVAKRIELLWPLYNKFQEKRKEITNSIVAEIGKPLKDVESEIERYSENFRWFLENGEKALGDEITSEDKDFLHKIVYEPIGVTAVITPWNQPYGMFIWGVIPNLIAGNPVVFKHSEECIVTASLLDEIIKSVKLPKGVFSQVFGDGRMGEYLINQDIDLIWFTGSSKVGKEIYKLAGEKFVKAVLEMGGLNPGLLFADVNVDRFLEKIYTKRFRNCGQTCDALKRLIVHESKFKEVIEKLKKVVEKKVVGDPEDKNTDIGSLVARRQMELLEAQVKDAVEKGTKVITGGHRPEGLRGAYYLPTILTNIKPTMRVWKEEVFGPVLSIVSFKTEEEAIKLANDTKYGLGALVFTNDKEKARRVASRLEAGTVEINNANHWLTCNPFGGYKDSGMGREHGIAGFRELTQIKVISIEK